MVSFWPFTKPEFTIESASSDDLAACADIHAASFSVAWGDGDIASMLRQKNTHCLVAANKGGKRSLIGFLVFRISAEEAEILTLAVLPRFRRYGAAGGLLNEMIQNCLSDRLQEIFLEVEAANTAALHLYHRFGFVKVGERKGYYRKPDADTSANGSIGSSGDALIMRLDLNS